MSLRRALLLLPALLVVLLIPVTPAAAQPTFTDTSGTAHEPAVSALVEQEILRGCDDERFCGDDALTRGQAATMMVSALDLPPVTTERFDDTADSRHTEAIDTLADEGVITGCDDGRFCPGDPVTREQLATMLGRGFEVPDAPEGQRYFEDVAGVHAPAVRALADSGIAAGCGDRLTSFCPGTQVSRAHAAMFFARTLDLVDRVEVAPFEEREAEQAKIDEQAAVDAAAARPTPADKAVDVALAQLGKPYRWGGSGPGSFDCSGLTSYAWAAAGKSLPHSSRAQYSATTRISRSQLQPGDLVFYHSPISHVAMYIGDGKVVEAPNAGNPVRVRHDGLTRRGVVGYGRP